MLPVGHGNGSIIKKHNRKNFNTFGFVDEKLQKSTRITLQYSIVNRRVSEFLSKNITFFLIIFFDDAAITMPNRKQFLFSSSLHYKCVKNGFQKDSLGVPD